MNQTLAQLAYKAGFVYIKDEQIGWAGNYNASLPEFAQLITKEVVKQMTIELQKQGIDHCNNPAFYKAVEKTLENFRKEAE